MNANYSTTPLTKKLGIKEGYKLLLNNYPKNYFDLISDLPSDIKLLKRVRAEEADFIHLFITSFDELHGIVDKYLPALNKNGLMWISWPKGGSEIVTDLKRDTIRNYIINIGLVDVKVASINENWSGLKFVYRVIDR